MSVSLYAHPSRTKRKTPPYTRTKPPTQVYLFHTVRDGAHYPLQSTLWELAAAHPVSSKMGAAAESACVYILCLL